MLRAKAWSHRRPTHPRCLFRCSPQRLRPEPRSQHLAERFGGCICLDDQLLSWVSSIERFVVNALAEAATSLDHFDFVAVGIGDEEEARERRALMLEIAQWAGRQFLLLESGVLGVEIVDDDGEMPIPAPRKVGPLR